MNRNAKLSGRRCPLASSCKNAERSLLSSKAILGLTGELYGLRKYFIPSAQWFVLYPNNLRSNEPPHFFSDDLRLSFYADATIDRQWEHQWSVSSLSWRLALVSRPDFANNDLQKSWWFCPYTGRKTGLKPRLVFSRFIQSIHKESVDLMNCMARLALFLLVAVFTCNGMLANGQDNEKELAISIIKTVGWRLPLSSSNVEISGVFGMQDDASIGRNANRSNYHERAYRLELLSDSRSSSFGIVASIGRSGLAMSGGQIDDSMDSTTSSFAICREGKLAFYEGNGRLQVINRFDRNGVFDVVPQFLDTCEPDYFPLRLLNDGNEPEKFIDILAEEILDGKLRGRVSVEDGKRNGRPVRIWRLTRDVEDDAIGAYRFEVSSDGYDKGLIVHYQAALLPVGFKGKYQSDSQLTGKFSSSTQTEWKQFTIQTDGAEDRELVLPYKINKEKLNTSGGKFLTTEMCTWDWKGFGPVEPKEFQVENFVSKAKAQTKEINRQLRR